MPTIAGLRRRGYTSESIRDFCKRIGVTKKENVIDIGPARALRPGRSQSTRAPRVMAVLRPLKVVLTNYPDDRVEPDGGRQQSGGSNDAGRVRCLLRRSCTSNAMISWRTRPRSSIAWHRAGRSGCAMPTSITCTEVVKDTSATIVELFCTYDPATRGGSAPDGRKVKATLHWVSASHAVDAEIRLYDRLFDVEDPESAAAKSGTDFSAFLNPSSLERVHGCQIGAEPRRRTAGGAISVRAPGILRRGPGLAPRGAGLQPHRVAQGPVGEDRGPSRIGRSVILGVHTCDSRPSSTPGGVHRTLVSLPGARRNARIVTGLGR